MRIRAKCDHTAGLSTYGERIMEFIKFKDGKIEPLISTTVTEKLEEKNWKQVDLYTFTSTPGTSL